MPTAHRQFSERTKAGLWHRLHRAVLNEQKDHQRPVTQGATGPYDQDCAGADTERTGQDHPDSQNGWYSHLVDVFEYQPLNC